MKILMIEDDEAIRTGLKYYLEQENFEVIETDNGKDALKYYQDNNISICLLDINLPDKNGFDLFKELSYLAQNSVYIKRIIKKQSEEEIIKLFNEIEEILN